MRAESSHLPSASYLSGWWKFWLQVRDTRGGSERRARGERDRIDRSTTFEGSLYSSFPDLRTQAWCRVALERGGVGSNTEWATGVGERCSSERISRSPFEHPSPLPCDNDDDCRFVFSFSSRGQRTSRPLITHDTRPLPSSLPLVVTLKPAFLDRDVMAN